MFDKYLPIGTVCTLKGIDRKVMIIGFLPIEYNKNIKMYDYQGCAYPEGLLLKNKLIAFNSSDIEELNFLGYKDGLHDNFNNILLNSTNQLDLTDDSKTTVSNFQFDENGVIIFDGTVDESDEESNDFVVDTSTSVVDNPFNVQYAPVEKLVNPNKNEILSPFVFDENGVIIADNTVSEDEEDETDEETESPFVFDENGVIVSDGTAPEETEEEPAGTPFVFDENGVIVSDGTAPEETEEEPAETPFVFDENGVIVSDGTAPEETEEELADSPFVFDENGLIVEN